MLAFTHLTNGASRHKTQCFKSKPWIFFCFVLPLGKYILIQVSCAIRLLLNTYSGSLYLNCALQFLKEKWKERERKKSFTHNCHGWYQLKPIGTKSLLLHLVAASWNWRLSMASGKHLKLSRKYAQFHSQSHSILWAGQNNALLNDWIMWRSTEHKRPVPRIPVSGWSQAPLLVNSRFHS